MSKNSKWPVVSVVMPVFNNARYLHQAIDSILNQSFKNFEFIIIEDGSIDPSAKVIQSYKDPRIKVIRHQKNKGLVFSLNQGIKRARGIYIVRMDGDDISLVSRLKEQVNYMVKNPTIGICGTWIKVFGEKESYVWRTPVNHEDIKARSIFETPIAHPSVIMRRSTIVKHHLYYKQKYALAEDYELWTRAANITILHSYPKVLLKYRVHAKQTGKEKLNPQKEMGKKIRLMQLARLHIHPTPRQKQLHETICHWEKVVNFGEVRAWLNTIAQANFHYRVFDEIALNNILIEKWFGLLALYQQSGLKRLWYGLRHGSNLKMPSLKFALNKLGILA